jgi:hypothetical protein
MKNNHLKNEEEYIDDLMDKMDKMNIKEEDKIEKIIKQRNQIIFSKMLLKWIEMN